MNVTERFLKYVAIDTQSDEDSQACPSTAKQLVLAELLVQELSSIGVSGARMDENGYVYGYIPATEGCADAPAVGLIAHMDTSPDVSGANVNPKIITFDGTNAPMIDEKYIGKQLIVTDGTTLLGADDKAGIAEIVTACEKILADKDIKHGKICIGFTPDEEIGRGADLFDVAGFGADYAYTVDGGELGGIDCENFNAAAVRVSVRGTNTHPGSAKGKMKNALLLLNEFINILPASEVPECTEGREGFYHITDISGTTSAAHLDMLIRDFDAESFETRKRFVKSVGDFLNAKHRDAFFDVRVKDSYRNMYEVIGKHPEIVERARQAMLAAGVQPYTSAIRGGTDGARLSFEGLPCPDLSAGGINFHSVYEAVPIEALEKMTEVLISLVKI